MKRCKGMIAAAGTASPASRVMMAELHNFKAHLSKQTTMGSVEGWWSLGKGEFHFCKWDSGAGEGEPRQALESVT